MQAMFTLSEVRSSNACGLCYNLLNFTTEKFTLFMLYIIELYSGKIHPLQLRMNSG